MERECEKVENLCKYLPFEVDDVHYAVPMEYVSYIVAASDSFPYCMPPGREPYVDRIMQIEQKLITVVELAVFGGDNSFDEDECLRPLILILSYQDNMIGLRTDHITSPVELSELKSDTDPMEQRTFLTCGAEQFLLFDVPKFYREITTR